MKLFVGNMPFSMDETRLRDLFSTHGTVASAAVITDRNSGRSRGFGFVEMQDGEAKSAMAALDGQDVDGRELLVNEARAREDRGVRGRGRY